MADQIESSEQFQDTPEGNYSRWSVEMDAADKNVTDWHNKGDEAIKIFLDDRGDSDAAHGETHVNLYTSNVQTLRALLYGKTPKVDAKRRFTDPNDDVARVTGEILERLLNTDIEQASDNYSTALEHALDDRLIPGSGWARARYVAEMEDQPPVPPVHKKDLLGNVVNGEDGKPVVLAPGYQPPPKKTFENVDIDYVHWRDVRWGPARTWDEVPWVAFKAELSRDDLIGRFGEEVGEAIPLASKRVQAEKPDEVRNDPWSRADVWEIWDKKSKKVWWWCKGYKSILDMKEDPLQLNGFFPCPRPMMANLTTSNLMPLPDYFLARDLYEEFNRVSTRITLLERAVAVRGAYDENSEELKRVLSEAVSNEMIPTKNWSMFVEKGGFKGVMDFLPLDMIVSALDKLREYRTELAQLIYQVTGMSDIMRGQSSTQTTATEQAIKAKFASVRVQQFQDEFARFATDLQAIKAEIISIHFDPQTIVMRANIQYMNQADQQLVQPAIQLLKSKFMQFRVQVKPESVSLTDYAAVREERSAVLTAVATFLQSSAPIAAQAPWAVPGLLEMLGWMVAGLRGSSSIEGVVDRMIISANQAMQQQAMQGPKPDPKLEAAQVKGQAEQFKAKADVVNTQVKLKADMAKMQMEHQHAVADHEMNMQRTQAKMRADAMKAMNDMEKGND